MSTTSQAVKTENAGKKYASKFYVETVGQGKPLEPTDRNLAETLKNCALRPRPEWFPAIRRVLADDYGITVRVEEIIQQGGGDAHLVAQAAATLKDRTTTELMDDYRETQRIGGESASEVRRWITAELIDRIGREAVIAFESRAANEANERAILARDARKGDIYVTRGNGLYVRREIVAVTSYRSGALIQLACADHTTPLLDAGQSIVVERDQDDAPDAAADPHEDHRALGLAAEEEAQARERERWAGEPDQQTSPTTREELLRDYHAAAHERDHGQDHAQRRAAGAQARRIGGELSQLGVWVFNGDYDDLAQIIPFIEPYWTIFEQIKAAGKYPYNSSFEGRIPGLEDALPREETPIYLLQQLRGLVEGHERLAQVLDAGYRRLTELATRERFSSVVVFDQFYATQRFADARVIPDEQHRASGVLPKGKRTRGLRVGSLDQVYVR